MATSRHADDGTEMVEHGDTDQLLQRETGDDSNVGDGIGGGLGSGGGGEAGRAGGRTEAPLWYAILLASSFLLLFSAYSTFQVRRARLSLSHSPSLSLSLLVSLFLALLALSLSYV